MSVMARKIAWRINAARFAYASRSEHGELLGDQAVSIGIGRDRGFGPDLANQIHTGRRAVVVVLSARSAKTPVMPSRDRFPQSLDRNLPTVARGSRKRHGTGKPIFASNPRIGSPFPTGLLSSGRTYGSPSTLWPDELAFGAWRAVVDVRDVG
jgi:hypothetical protein